MADADKKPTPLIRPGDRPEKSSEGTGYEVPKDLVKIMQDELADPPYVDGKVNEGYDDLDLPSAQNPWPPETSREAEEEEMVPPRDIPRSMLDIDPNPVKPTGKPLPPLPPPPSKTNVLGGKVTLGGDVVPADNALGGPRRWRSDRGKTHEYESTEQKLAALIEGMESELDESAPDEFPMRAILEGRDNVRFECGISAPIEEADRAKLRKHWAGLKESQRREFETHIRRSYGNYRRTLSLLG